MGSKVPAILKSRRTTCKCDSCGRGFLNIQALRTHQAFMHPRSRKRVAYKPKPEVIAKRKVNPAPESVKPARKMPAEKIVKEKSLEEKKPESGLKEARKVEFECPKCSKIFSVYFCAFKHIQKNHCVNSRGQPVSPTSKDLIKPIRVEICISCNKKVGDMLHVCNARQLYMMQTMKSNMTCLGCDKEFVGMLLFDSHISGLHSDDAESMFFPMVTEFTSWKIHMEAQTQASYILYNKTTNKHIYRCSFFLPGHNDLAQLCPSSIVLQEFPKGVQIHFYKGHYGHLCKEYKVTEGYKKYTLSVMLKNPEITAVQETEKDKTKLYIQFKKVMESIVFESANIKFDCLQKLQEKATEMQAVLKEMQAEDDKHAIEQAKKMTDDEISSLLEEVGTRSKRKQRLATKIQQINQNHEEKDVTPAKKVKKADEIEVKNTPLLIKSPSILVQSPSNFNDSFKNFVVQVSGKVSEEKGVTTRNSERKKVVLKTKMGQYNPLSPKRKEVKKEVINEVVNDVKNEVKKVENKEVKKVENKEVKKVVNKEVKKVVNKEVKKVLKKDVKNEQKKEEKKVQVKFNVQKLNLPKVELNYEVKEQDNDCNILVLKI